LLEKERFWREWYLGIDPGEKDVQLSVLKMYLIMFLVQNKYNVMHF